MTPSLHSLIGAEHAKDLRRTAAALARARGVSGGRRGLLGFLPRARAGQSARPQPPLHAPVTIRYAFPDDAISLARLAALDSREPLVQPVLVVEVDGELHAGLSLRDGTIVADPFRPTAALVELLIARSQQLRASAAGGTPERPAASRLVRPAWRRS
jgi:hypothetical protein